MKNIKNYVRAGSLEEAWQLNQNKKNRILGGMLWLRLEGGDVDTAIDLCELGLDKIEETKEQFSIGAMVSLHQLELHEGLNAYTENAVKDALKDIVGVQFRNMATVGGSLWGRFGFSDVLTLFLLLDTYVELYKGGRIPLEEFAARKPDRDILLRIVVKKRDIKTAYAAMRNQRTDFPVIACGISCIDGAYRVSVGARPGRAMVFRDEQGMLEGAYTQEKAKAFAEMAAQKIPTESNVRASASYRTHLIRGLVLRLLEKVEAQEHTDVADGKPEET